MLAQTMKVDRAGALTLPQQSLDALGIRPESEVVVEWTETRIVIRPKSSPTPITDRLAAMDLPVADWDEMELEIESGRYD